MDQANAIPTERIKFEVPDGAGRAYAVTLEHPAPFLFAGMTLAVENSVGYTVHVKINRSAGMSAEKMATLMNGTATIIRGNEGDGS